MQVSGGGGRVVVRLPRAINTAAKILAVLVSPWVLACAGAGTAGPDGLPEVVPVFLPGERVDCLFEVVGEVTVRGPFRARDDIGGGSREVLMRGVRLEVGREGAETGADAVMVRQVLYEQEPTAAEDNIPEIIAVEGMLLSFVDPNCVPGG